jgi:error-prone DNA polymerase
MILSARLLSCRGRVQREGEVIRVVAEQLDDLTPWLSQIGRAVEEPDPRAFRARDFR